MAQLHFDGFELGILPDYVVAGTWGTTATTAFGTGLALFQGSSGVATVTRQIPASAEVYVGVRFFTSGSNTNAVISLFGDTGATEHLRIWWSNPTTLNLGRAGTSIATAAIAEPAGSWVFIEMRATIADTGGRAVVRIDGTTVIDFTGDTKNAGTNSTVDAVRLTGTGGASVTRSFDDLYINDATGAAPHNTFYGPVRVYTLSPNGPGTDTQFTPSSGANWTCVDEQPYSATDYVTASAVGTRDTYAMADLPASVSQVFGVRPTVIAKATDATAVGLKTATRSGGNVYTGTATALGATDGVVSAIRSTDPATGAAWTVAGVNAAEAGFEVA